MICQICGYTALAGHNHEAHTESKKMTKLQDEIINIVNRSQGIKERDLTIQLVTKFLEVEIPDILAEINGLVSDGKIAVIELQIPYTSGGPKLLYLPINTIVIQ